MAVITKSNVGVVILNPIEDHESLFIKLTCWGSVFILVAVYRHPGSDFVFLRKLFHRLEKYHNQNIILVGYFNLPDVDWERLKEFTRVQGCARSILDLIFVSCHFSDYTISVEECSDQPVPRCRSKKVRKAVADSREFSCRLLVPLPCRSV